MRVLSVREKRLTGVPRTSLTPDRIWRYLLRGPWCAAGGGYLGAFDEWDNRAIQPGANLREGAAPWEFRRSPDIRSFWHAPAG
jgi:hypothetical protein